jgi:hypothetical protein
MEKERIGRGERECDVVVIDYIIIHPRPAYAPSSHPYPPPLSLSFKPRQSHDFSSSQISSPLSKAFISSLRSTSPLFHRPSPFLEKFPSLVSHFPLLSYFHPCYPLTLFPPPALFPSLRSSFSPSFPPFSVYPGVSPLRSFLVRPSFIKLQ